jgi:hypothetical protein
MHPVNKTKSDQNGSNDRSGSSKEKSISSFRSVTLPAIFWISSIPHDTSSAHIPLPIAHLISPLTTQFSIPRIRRKLTLINRLQLWTPQRARHLPHRRIQRSQRARRVGEQPLEDIRRFALRGLEGEAREIVALGQGLRVVDAAGEVGDRDAGEGVGLAGVAADGEAAG